MVATWPPQLNTAPSGSTLLLLLADTAAWSARRHAVPGHHLDAHSIDMCSICFSMHAIDTRTAMDTFRAWVGYRIL